jgi:hypothetical protein
MALDYKEGFEIRIPLALTLIGGLTFGTFLTLVFIPLVYDKVIPETGSTEAAASRLMALLKKAKGSPAAKKATEGSA